MRRTPVLIVGGGPAGSAAALTLARAGLEPELVERSRGPRDVVCGGFLGWTAMRHLAELGIDLAALGARPITRMRLVAGKRSVEAALPHAAAGLSRRVLDAALLDAAEAAGARVRRGVAVRSADPERRAVRIGDEDVACEALFLATGKHELRGAARTMSVRPAALSVGMRASLPASPELERALAGTVELHLIEGGYVGLLLQEDGQANLCLSVATPRLNAAGGAGALFDAILREAPVLTDRVGSQRPARFEAVAAVPYGWITREALPGVFRTGDQAAVIASLAGEGIAIALSSGRSAAEALMSYGVEGAADWQSRFRSRARPPVALAEALRHAAQHRWSREPLVRLLQLAPGLATRAAALTRAYPS